MSVSMAVQCLCIILNALLAFGQYQVANVGFFLSIGMSECLVLLWVVSLSALLLL